MKNKSKSYNINDILNLNFFKNKNITLAKIMENISSNKYFIGIMMIFMNIGSRYIEIKLTKQQEAIFKSIARELLIFTIAFMGSRDLFVAFIITAIFIVLSNYVFNENSKYNLLPKNFNKLENIMDTNKDGELSEEEVNKAYDIIKRAKQKENVQNKIKLYDNLS
jgi:hypothetical protein|tara:strand:- start:3270 stop:3764 length:495 start_codon:yes stop_codon:yes gene_type:complete